MLAALGDIGTEWYVHPARGHEFRDILQREGRVEDFVSEVYRHKTRERIWISESARLVRNESGAPLFYEGSVREITGDMRRLAAEEQLQRLSSQLPGALFQFTRFSDNRGEVNYLSAGSTRITGVPVHEMRDNPALFTEMVLEADREEYLNSLNEASSRRSSGDISLAPD